MTYKYPRRALLALVAGCALLPAGLAAQSAPPDPFQWLEEVEGQRAMEWVRAKNAATVSALEKTPI